MAAANIHTEIKCRPTSCSAPIRGLTSDHGSNCFYDKEKRKNKT